MPERQTLGRRARSARGDGVSGQKGTGPLDVVLTLLISVVLVFGVVRPFIVEAYYVPSGSMEPTLMPGDRVLAAKFYYRFFKPQRGDLVVFSDPGIPRETLVKRVVGLPGDTVAIKDGILYINGEPKKEPYVDHRLTDSTFFGPVRVPRGHVFVMGDNRTNSVDSRSFGPVPQGDLLGKVFLRFWPLDRMGIP